MTKDKTHTKRSAELLLEGLKINNMNVYLFFLL